MSQDDEQAQAGAEDQHEGAGDDLDTKDDTDTGADDQGTDDDGKGADDANQDGFEAQFKDQQKRANKYEGFLKQNGIDPKTGKPKENKRAPNKDANVLSEQDSNRITKAEDRAERAEIRSLGYTHPEDIEFLSKQARRNFDGDVFAAAEDEFVKSKLTRMKATRDTKDATPTPNKRGASAPNKKLPDFSKMSNAEFDKWEKENRA